MDTQFRKPTEYEKCVFAKLLNESFPGSREIREQLEHCRVRTIDSEGSLEIEPAKKTLAAVAKRIPVEAYAEDSDGVKIHALLHVVNGTVHELEFYKDDSSKIINRPTDWQTMVLSP